MQKNAKIQQQESVIHKKEVAIQDQARDPQQKAEEIQKHVDTIEQIQQEREQEVRIKKMQKKWKDIFPEIEEIFKSEFFTITKNENWRCPEDFEILEAISER